MKTKNILYIASILLASLIVSCSTDPVILEFDDSYTPDKPIPGKRDTPPPADVLTVYGRFNPTNEDVVVARIIETDGSLTVNNIQPVILNINTSIKSKEELVFSIEKMTLEKDNETYQKIIKGSVLELPSDSYQLSSNEVKIVPGEKVKTIEISFNKEKFKELNKERTYAIPLKLTLKKGTATVLPSPYVLNVSLTESKKLPNGNNVSTAYSIESNRILDKNAFNLESDYASGHLWKLKDNKSSSGSWWVKSGSSTSLNINLTKLTKVKSLRMKLKSYNGRIKTVSVSASNTKGETYINQGVAKFENDEPEWIYIVFDQPIYIDAIKLSDFTSDYTYIDIYELDIYFEK